MLRFYIINGEVKQLDEVLEYLERKLKHDENLDAFINVGVDYFDEEEESPWLNEARCEDDL